MNLKRVVEKVYVVAVSIGLVLVLAHWFRGTERDPLLAAQNSRIRFQTGGETAKNYAGLTPSEIVLAESVLEKQRAPDGKHTELLYVGNSQTIAIMDQTPGDMIAPQWLQILLARKYGLAQPVNGAPPPIFVNLGSLPNITAPELLVRLSAKSMSTILELLLQLLEVIDLTVEYHADRAVFIEDWLVSALDVNDA